MQPFDPNKTIAGSPTGGQATQAMPAMPDANRTQAVSIMPAVPGVQLSLIPGREASMANGPAREQFLLELSAGTGIALPGVGESGPRTALNLCLVLDRSGSMEGAPMEYAKQACQYVVDLLGPNDILSIVTFEERVDVLMPPQRVTNKQMIKDGIARLQVGNTTNLYDGLSLGMQQLLGTSEASRATRMVVLSDGDPTAGITDFHSLVNHAGDIKSRGVSITFLGFGPDYNEELLASMAKKAGGNYAYIPRPEILPEVFRLEVDKMLSAAATSITFELKTARWVTLRSCTGLPTPPSGNSFSFPIADLERGALIQQVFDFEAPNHPLGHYRIAGGTLSYDDASTGRRETRAVDFVLEFTADAARYSAPVDPRVAQASEIVAVSQSVEKTVMGLKTGAFTQQMAVAELQKTQALLLADGRISDAQEVTMALRALQSGDQGSAEKTLMGTVVNLGQGKTTG